MSLDFKSTAAFSFEAKSDDGKVFEADFGLLWRERNAKGIMDGVVFGECKTFNRLRMTPLCSNPHAQAAFKVKSNEREGS